MRTAIMIVGLPASGKSHLIHSIKRDAQVYDDIYCDIENETSDHIILSNPAFCIEKVRKSVFERLEAAGFSVAICYFENNPVQCLQNAKFRPDKKVTGYIQYLSQLYIPPTDCVIPVWTPKS